MLKLCSTPLPQLTTTIRKPPQLLNVKTDTAKIAASDVIVIVLAMGAEIEIGIARDVNEVVIVDGSLEMPTVIMAAVTRTARMATHQTI
jgi:hypothetical protein